MPPLPQNGDFIFAKMPNGEWGVMHVGVNVSVYRSSPIKPHDVLVKKIDGQTANMRLGKFWGVFVERLNKNGDEVRGCLYSATSSPASLQTKSETDSFTTSIQTIRNRIDLYIAKIAFLEGPNCDRVEEVSSVLKVQRIKEAAMLRNVIIDLKYDFYPALQDIVIPRY